MDSTEPSRYWIPPHVRVCATITGTVVLDLQRSLYLSIGIDETRALLALDERRGQANMLISTSLAPMTLQSAARMAPALVDAGLLTREAARFDLLPPPLAVELGVVRTSVGHEVSHSVSIGSHHIFQFLRACAWAKHAVRFRTLFSVARELEQGKSRHPGTFEDRRVVELVCVFRRLRPFTFTAKNQCLFHALALVRFLSYFNVFPAWVIGVRARPWAAHSWVQHGRLLLDSNPEHICEYTPILTV